MPSLIVKDRRNSGIVERLKGAFSGLTRGFNWTWAEIDASMSQGIQVYSLPGLSGKISTSNMRSMVSQYFGWVYKCSSFNAQAAAKVPLRLYISEKEAIGGPGKQLKSPPMKRWNFPTRRVEDKSVLDYLRSEKSFQRYVSKGMVVEEVFDHPLLTLLRQVNYGTNGFDLIELSITYQELTGNAYWYVQSAEVGGIEVPVALYQVMPQYMTIVHSKKKGIIGYVWQKDTPQKIPFEPDEIIHFKYPNPHNAVYGMGKVAGAANDIDIENKMTEWQTGLLDNRAVPEYALVLPAGDTMTTASEYQDMLDQWNKRNRGGNKAGSMGLLEGGIKIEKLSYSPEDLGFAKEQEWIRDKIGSLFGIPKGLLTSDNVNKANAQVSETVHARNCIHPILRRLQDKLNEQLTPRYDRHLFLAFDNPVPEDKKMRLEEIEKKLKVGYSSINMEREKDGEAPVEWGDIPIMISNMVPLGSMPPGQPPSAGTGITGEQVRDIIEDAFNDMFGLEEDWKGLGEIKKEAGGSEPELKIGSKMPEGVKDLFWRIYDKSVEIQKTHFEIEVVKFFKKQGRKVLREFDRLAKGRKDLSAEIMLFDMDKATKTFSKVSEPYVRTALVEAGQGIINMLGRPDVVFDVADPKVREYTGTRLQKFSRRINQTTKDRVQDALRLGYEAQESIPDIRSRVELVFEQATKEKLDSPSNLPGWRAELIARTEISGAHNFGNMTGMKQVGVFKHMWLTSRDAIVRDSHVMLDGIEVAIGASFPGYTDGFDTTHPSSYNERCTTIPSKMKQPEIEEGQSAVEALSEIE